MAYLVRYLCNNLMTDRRKEFFVVDDTMFAAQANTNSRRLRSISRPGILVLVNDADWELEGEGKYILQTGDEILFVSTLHGG